MLYSAIAVLVGYALMIVASTLALAAERTVAAYTLLYGGLVLSICSLAML